MGSWDLGRYFQYPTDKGDSGLADKPEWWETQGLVYMVQWLALEHERPTALADKDEILFC